MQAPLDVFFSPGNGKFSPLFRACPKSAEADAVEGDRSKAPQTLSCMRCSYFQISKGTVAPFVTSPWADFADFSYLKGVHWQARDICI